MITVKKNGRVELKILRLKEKIPMKNMSPNNNPKHTIPV
jgi:hypothetical protein